MATFHLSLYNSSHGSSKDTEKSILCFPLKRIIQFFKAKSKVWRSVRHWSSCLE